CYFTATRLKHKLGYDDTLDVFGVHAIAGIVGALLTGPLASASLGGFGNVASVGGQLWIQAKGVCFTVIWSGLLSWLILKLVDWTIGLRVTDEQEQMGLDLALHEERAYNLSWATSAGSSWIRRRHRKIRRHGWRSARGWPRRDCMCPPCMHKTCGKASS